MAILKDYINQVTFEEVWNVLGAGKEALKEYEEAYRGIFNELRETEPQENQSDMTIRFVMEEDEPLWYFDFGNEETEDGTAEEDTEAEGMTLQVYGFIPGDDEGYAIGMKPPAVLVGLTVDEETGKNYSPAEIVANCIAEMSYNSTVASSAYGMDKDMAGGGLLASQACMSEDIQNIDLNKLRESLGVLPKHEDYKEKYGFLF